MTLSIFSRMYLFRRLFCILFLLSSTLRPISSCIPGKSGKGNELTADAFSAGYYCTNGSSGNNTDGYCGLTKLLVVQVIFRHGDRTLIFHYPKDPNQNSSGVLHLKRKGILTNKGKVQAYELGQYLHSRYRKFLKGTLIPEEVLVQSSEISRAIMTAQMCLAGLFPPCEAHHHQPGCEGKWDPSIKWQPVPVYQIPRKLDNKILFQRDTCPAYTSEFKRVLECPLIEEFKKSHQETFQYIKEHTGMDEVNIENVGQVHDTLFIQSLYNISLPNWTEKVYPEPMKTMSDLGFQILSANREMMKFNGGPLLKEVIENMESTVEFLKCPKKQKEKKRVKKVYLYSGHDTTVAAFLATLSVFDTHQPPYTSAVIVELHQMQEKGSGSKKHLVKVFYRNSTAVAPREMIIPDCGNPCHLDKLKEVVRDLLLEDWGAECNQTFFSYFLDWLSRPLTYILNLLAEAFADTLKRLRCCLHF
ncbi:Lysosomal acid phosphatase [Orchesella cincta]|uniref:acid phosphatase n=1 Tax=Orchesella cincta TaxID=48709 RepID=A0A1D2NEZ3_ORCCI|nr:Lysosomal acid phosphatase [Orchesella cincta]